MNRIIMFRGRAVADGKYRYGDLCHFESGKCAITENGTTYGVIPETVGEYTGLRDRYSNDIFEGDVVNVYLEGDVTIVLYVKYQEGLFNIAEYAGNVKEIIC
jgi:hypothetical protein